MLVRPNRAGGVESAHVLNVAPPAWGRNLPEEVREIPRPPVQQTGVYLPVRVGVVRGVRSDRWPDRIRAQLAGLKLPGALEALDPILSGVDGGRFTAAEAIEKLLAAQIGLRNNRRLQAAMRASRLPAVKTLADFGSRSSPTRPC